MTAAENAMLIALHGELHRAHRRIGELELEMAEMRRTIANARRSVGNILDEIRHSREARLPAPSTNSPRDR